MPTQHTLSLHETMRNARRQHELSQATLALEVGCKQSAISMFEAGRADALSGEKVARIAARLGLDSGTLAGLAGDRETGQRVTLKYCPVDECPANVPYVVRGQVHFKPTMVESTAGESTRCAFCGEVLEDRCPNHDCGAPLADGSFCRQCGSPYIAVAMSGVEVAPEWAETQRVRIKEIRSLTETRRRSE